MGLGSGYLFGLGFAFACILVLGLATTGLHMFKSDTTDPKGGHSGLTVLTDAGTGREYLMSPTGFLTPRLSPPSINKENQCPST